VFLRRLAGIAAAGFLLRFAVVQWVPTQPTSDFWSYYHRGLNLAAHGSYEAIPGRVDASYPPLYPLLLAAAFLPAPAHTLGAAKLVNCLLGAAAIAVAGLLARRLAGNRAGLLAAGILALLPRALLLPCLVASENLFSPLLLLYVWIVVEGGTSRGTMRLAALAGLVVALAALTRSVAYYAFALWPIAAVAGRRRLRAVLGQMLLLLAVQHAVMLPWALRNRAQLGRFTFLSTGGGYGLFLGNNPNATGDWYDGRADLEKAAPGALAKGAAATSDAASAAALRWMRENPGAAFRLYLVKFGIIFRQTYVMASFAVTGRNVTPPPRGLDVLPWPHVLKDHPHALNGVLWATGWALVAAGLAGWALLLRRARATRDPVDAVPALVLPAATLYVPVVSALIAVNGRYRWPVEDLLVPAAAVALSALWSILIRQRRTVEPAAA
jgi:4-amino-4-deoxy-L-arabinose transferase-like glycosyltransferase